MAIWVVCEGSGSSFRPASLELLSRARALGGPTCGVVFDGDGPVQGLDGLADRIVHITGVGPFDPDRWFGPLSGLLAREKPALVLMGDSTRTRELLPRLAVTLSATPLANGIALDRSAAGFVLVRPVLGGKAYATYTLPSPSVCAFRPNSFDPDAPGVSSTTFEAVEGGAVPSRIEVLETRPHHGARVALTEARCVVSVGRGLKAPENLSLAEDLAAALGGAVGFSRAIVDAGWVSHSNQVGKSGKTVSPALYIAAGISGAVHHTMGMDTAKVVVAINTNPKALIFNCADYGIVGDALAVLPAITAEVRKVAG